MKAKDIQKMNKEEKAKNLKDLKLELIKSKVNASKAGSSKIKEIKKTIARILTLNNSNKTGDKSSVAPKSKQSLSRNEVLKKE